MVTFPESELSQRVKMKQFQRFVGIKPDKLRRLGNDRLLKGSSEASLYPDAGVRIATTRPK